ncbi:Sugar transferase involved in LPS biosynthesis (colanic, teichoic acid) [Actinopolymorpha cephalotaxi]|uniref:Sugar transferase involved in LPS biosynthesis (Colanic, teichoic acid) n=2 Tax=Actinopolymorpha cephalotaxi TaxID=504797 RepID=A0A1I2T7U6_9ACTN|nr:Sugar transferase involved in LPS biosynthesis (colanic, teichoic acid) [Actinopolymorpha cephalotaxi]
MLERTPSAMTKRLFDVLVAAFLLVVLSPVFLAVATVSLLGGGPVLFRQERVGLAGRAFLIHKFRTMRDATGPGVTSDRDPRITRLGRILRATKLDELPQLYDVLTGTMSLVGPRPEVRKYVAHWPAAVRDHILSVRPGITDPASITYRTESAELALAADPEEHYVSVVLPRKVQMYAAYVDTRSFLGDLKILAGTVRALVAPRSSGPNPGAIGASRKSLPGKGGYV